MVPVFEWEQISSSLEHAGSEPLLGCYYTGLSPTSGSDDQHLQAQAHN